LQPGDSKDFGGTQDEKSITLLPSVRVFRRIRLFGGDGAGSAGQLRATQEGCGFYVQGAWLRANNQGQQVHDRDDKREGLQQL
jgi:hypothetical protein